MSNFTFKKSWLAGPRKIVNALSPEWWIALLAFVAAIIATIYSFIHGYITAYGDAESHLNIAKRVVDSLTPGFAQLGGIWLPLPHVLMVPFVWNDYLWKTGLAGSIVSGICFIVSAVFMYKLVHLLTSQKAAAFFGALVFALNLNMLYMQSTPMTEPVLIVFFILASYYFILFLYDDTKLLNLVLAGVFTFCATLSRYDGWGLALMEAAVLALYYWPFTISSLWLRKFLDMDERETAKSETAKKDALTAEMAAPSASQDPLTTRSRSEMFEGRMLFFCIPAFFGIVLWFIWGWLILGDPLYFTHSQFSAKSQQNSWLSKGELPAYQHMFVAIQYYLAASLSNIGIIVSIIAVIGFLIFIFDRKAKYRVYTILILLVPFIFNVATLYLGQSVIFIPSITPITFEWTLFNVRYGLMMVPFAAVFAGYLFSKLKVSGKSLVLAAFAFSFVLYGVGYAHVIDLQDGTIGLSSGIAKIPDAQNWLAEHYDYGYILTDDYARTISLIRLPIKMQDDIYIGNKPYWGQSLIAPEMYARWIVMQKNDALWTAILENPVEEARLYKYFNKEYTSDNILIFRRIDSTDTASSTSADTDATLASSSTSTTGSSTDTAYSGGPSTTSTTTTP